MQNKQSLFDSVVLINHTHIPLLWKSFNSYQVCYNLKIRPLVISNTIVPAPNSFRLVLFSVYFPPVVSRFEYFLAVTT